MENASKALLLAAAILIAIILISLGVYIVSQGQSTITQSTDALSEVEVEAFNSKFRAFEGTITGSNVKSLIQRVNTSNQTNPGQLVSIEAGTGTTLTDIVESGTAEEHNYKASKKIGNNTKYEIELSYNGSVVEKITVTTTKK